MNPANRRAVIVTILLFALLFLFAYLTRNANMLQIGETDESPASSARSARAALCPLGDYDKLRGLMVIWRGETAMVAERPWRCLTPGEQSMMVEMLLKQRGGKAALEVRSADTGQRLALAEPRRAPAVD